MFAPVFLLLASALVVTPEADVAPVRMDRPAPGNTTRVIPMSDGFLVAQGSDGLGFVTPLDREGRPEQQILIPSPAGRTRAIAGAGKHALVLEPLPAFFDPVARRTVERTRVLLINEEGIIEREVYEIGSAVALSHRSVVWTGREYVLAWTELPSKIVRAMRVGGDGAPLSGPFEVTTTPADTVVSAPFLATDGRTVILSIVGGEKVLIFKFGASDAAQLHVMNPAKPRVVDLLYSSGTFFLLLAETADNFSVFNLYRIFDDGGTAHATWLPAADWQTPELLDLEDGVLVYGVKPPPPLRVPQSVIAQRFSSLGIPVSEPKTLINTTDYLYGVTAARRDDVIAFAFNESAIVKTATVDSMLSSGTDAVPLALGASRRTTPSVAATEAAVLNIWLEPAVNGAVLAGSIRRTDGTEIILAISDLGARSPHVATNGSSFLVSWWQVQRGIVARVVHADGQMGDVVTVAERRGDRPRVAWSSSSYVIVWHEIITYPFVQRYGQIYATTMDSNGVRAQSDPQLVDYGSEPAISSDGERVLLVWTEGTTCSPIVCQPMARLALRGQIFSPSLEPITSSFVVADDTEADEINAGAASSGDGWLVAWTAVRTDYHPIPGGQDVAVQRSVIRYANLSSAGFVQNLYQHRLDDPKVVQQKPAIAWTGKHYVMIFESDDALYARRLNRAGARLDLEDVLVNALGMNVAAAGLPGGAAIIYERRAPERLIGPAEQVFTRFIDDSFRRRAVSR